MKTLNVHEAKTHFSRLLDRVEAGEEIVLARAGKPVARLVPLQAEGERIPGSYPMVIPDTFFDPLPETELEAWER
jgi:prevent-host-death family protein